MKLQATGAIAEQIKKDFGSYDEFKTQVPPSLTLSLCWPPPPFPPLPSSTSFSFNEILHAGAHTQTSLQFLC